jgi:hypothetical protein
MSSRNMTPKKLEALGHQRMSPLKALRLRCLDCCVGSAHEVALCVATKCPAWPFRMGTNPWVGENMRRSHRPPPPTSPSRLRAETPASAQTKSEVVTDNTVGLQR